jgi:hypothetical protein
MNDVEVVVVDHDEMSAAQAYIAWQANPCGKPPLVLRDLRRFKERQEMPCMAVDWRGGGIVGTMRRVALTNLEGAYHYDQAFPGDLAGYFEGTVDGVYMIEIYGKGEPWPPKPAPNKPEFLR